MKGFVSIAPPAECGQHFALALTDEGRRFQHEISGASPRLSSVTLLVSKAARLFIDILERVKTIDGELARASVPHTARCNEPLLNQALRTSVHWRRRNMRC